MSIYNSMKTPGKTQKTPNKKPDNFHIAKQSKTTATTINKQQTTNKKKNKKKQEKNMSKHILGARNEYSVNILIEQLLKGLN